MEAIDSGDTAWLLVSSALVFVMTPGLGFFYGGLVGHTNVLNTIMMSLACGCLVILQWIIVGYSFALGPGNAFFGGRGKYGLEGNINEPNPVYITTVPESLYAMYQMTFAMITPALISGAIAARLRFRAWILFTIIWTTVVYDPVAHWVWASWFDMADDGSQVQRFGWLRAMGVLDFAGGTVVHITSGFSALAAAIIVGRRKTDEEMHQAHNLPLTVLGTALLWFGWFGFNGGSALITTDGIAALAILNTNIAAAAATTIWMALDAAVNKRVSIAGACTGAVVGLVTITPAAGFVRPLSSIAMGAIGAAMSFLAMMLKVRLQYDDVLDVFACHGVGGLVGAILTGFFSETAYNHLGANGLFFGGAKLLGLQVLGAVVTAIYSVVLTSAILLILKYTPFLGLRPSEKNEIQGMDFVSHKEFSYRLMSNKAQTREMEMDGVSVKGSPADQVIPAPLA